MTDPLLPKRFQTTSFGDIAYLEVGTPDRPPVLFVHGIPTSSYLWRHVLRFVQNDLHAYAVDLMGLGDTRVDPATGRFTMDAQADMLLELMEALGHERFAVVCHDQGGAAAQLLAANQPDRLTALVITDSVCYDNWPVPAIERLQRLMAVPVLPDLLARTGVAEWLQTATPLSDFKRGVFRPERLTAEAIGEYLRPLRASREGRERFRRFALAGHPRYTELAVPGLRAFHKPTLIAWAAEDRYLSPSWGLKLYEDIPGASRFELVPFCGHFWQEECPAPFASLIGAFLTEHLAKAADAPDARLPDVPVPAQAS